MEPIRRSDAISRPQAAFLGVFVAALLVGGFEALRLMGAAAVGLDPSDRVLAGLYSLSPYVTLGAIGGVITSALLAIGGQLLRRLPATYGRGTSAGLMAALAVFAGLGLASSRLILSQIQSARFASAAIALTAPILGALALWVFLEVRARVSGAVPERLRRQAALGRRACLAGGLTVAVATTVLVARHDALRNSLPWWSLGFAAAHVTLASAIAAGLRRFGSAAAVSGLGRHMVALVAAVSITGSIDLMLFMDARAAVKYALLEQTLVLGRLAALAQPVLDADGDGHAGLLGGGDCDDANPDVHPAAREIPGNGRDDDCFGGDAETSTDVDPPASPPPPAIPPTRASDEEALARMPHPPKRARPPSFVMITIDTIRADHLGCYGYSRPTSPTLDALARRGVRFEWALAQAPQTKASMPSLFMSRYYSEIERSPHLWAKIHEENTTLAERLRDAGYHTAGIPAHRFFLPQYGMNQGFVEWDLTIVRRHGKRVVHVSTSETVTERAVAWLERRERPSKPFFLWLHYFDPHHFYQNHDEPEDFGEEDVDRYDEEIRFVDTALSALFEAIDRGPDRDDTYVIVHGDHGEGFGEHNYRYHGRHLYNDQVRVPLIIAGPGITAGVGSTPVALVDLSPTILDLAGVPAGDALRGTSLRPYLQGALDTPHAPVFTEMVRDARHSDRRAMVDWPWKLHYGAKFDEYGLFNLATDPNETRNLVKHAPEIFDAQRARLRHWMSQEVEPATPHN